MRRIYLGQDDRERINREVPLRLTKSFVCFPECAHAYTRVTGWFILPGRFCLHRQRPVPTPAQHRRGDYGRPPASPHLQDRQHHILCRRSHHSPMDWTLRIQSSKPKPSFTQASPLHSSPPPMRETTSFVAPAFHNAFGESEIAKAVLTCTTLRTIRCAEVGRFSCDPRLCGGQLGGFPHSRIVAWYTFHSRAEIRPANNCVGHGVRHVFSPHLHQLSVTDPTSSLLAGLFQHYSTVIHPRQIFWVSRSTIRWLQSPVRSIQTGTLAVSSGITIDHPLGNTF